MFELCGYHGISCILYYVLLPSVRFIHLRRGGGSMISWEAVGSVQAWGCLFPPQMVDRFSPSKPLL